MILSIAASTKSSSEISENQKLNEEDADARVHRQGRARQPYRPVGRLSVQDDKDARAPAAVVPAKAATHTPQRCRWTRLLMVFLQQ
jgi:hypothetical protein